MKQRVFGVAGWKNSGKTTMTERLVAEFTRRGRTVATVKHAHHDADVDHEGTDSFRHRRAGAREVALVTGRRWALMHELRGEPEPSLADILVRLSPCDLVLVEGFKREAHAKLELRRKGAKEEAPLAPGDPSIVAIAADIPVAEAGVPVFHLDDIGAIADFIEQATGLAPPHEPPAA
ncbi:MAG TPA: molybdopterin-guanine dinucleotide biosynthesis protein B [Rhizobiales bacterium]|nr:molybdopterin-guanine dinucleotide biosynthesis protein B [Hyphomicrobiales bacterium]